VGDIDDKYKQLTNFNSSKESAEKAIAQLKLITHTV
jgi:hypothetical protein